MVEPPLNRLPHEIWLMISNHLSPGDLSAFLLALPEVIYAGIHQTLAFPAAEELHLMLLLVPLVITLKIAGEPFATNELMKYYSAQSCSELLQFERGAIHALNT